MKKRLLALLLVFVTVLGSCFAMAACGGKKEEKEEPYVLEADSYNMGSGENTLEKMLMGALSYAKNFAVGKLKSFAISKAIWAGKGILVSLGYEIPEEETFDDILLNRLDNINCEIVELEGKIDWLTSQYSDSQYLNKYNDFVNAYGVLSRQIKVPYRYLDDIEKEIQQGQADNFDESIKEICACVNGEINGYDNLSLLMKDFGSYFIGSTSSVNALQTYSIFNIVDRFVCAQTPYKENRHKMINEIVSEPYAVYYAAYLMVTMSYTRDLNELGISDFWMDADGEVIAYRAQNEDGTEEVIYLNCLNKDRDKFADKYKDLIDADISSAQALRLNNYDASAHRIAGDLAQVIGQYNLVSKLYSEFVEKYETDDDNIHLTLADGGQKTDKNVKTLIAKDFLTMDKDYNFKVEYSKFGNISKSDFINYVKKIEPYSYTANPDGTKKSLTFREFYVREGYLFPDNNKANLLILGAEKGYEDYDDAWNNGYSTKNHFFICCVDLDMKIGDFNKDPKFTKVDYGEKIVTVDHGGCKGSEKYYYVFEGTSNVRENLAKFSARTAQSLDGPWKSGGQTVEPIKFYTIFGLTANPKTSSTYEKYF